MALLGLIFALPACQPVWEETGWHGQSEAQVVGRLGAPDWSTTLQLSGESRLLEYRGGLEKVIRDAQGQPIEVKEYGWKRWFGTTAVWFSKDPHGEWKVVDAVSWRKGIMF